jgi:ComF family protein
VRSPGRIARACLSRLAFLAADPSCPVCRAFSAAKPLCEWCSLRLYANEAPHWSGSGAAVLDGIPGDGVAIESAFVHSGAAREIVHLLKFGGRRSLGRVAARLILASSSELPGHGDLVVPVPLGSDRLRRRGYNQSRLVAAPLARMCGALHADALRRDDRPPQVGLAAEERRANLKGSFRAVRGRVPPGATCWVVDDVATTGATVSEAAEALLDAGAGAVRAITLTYRKLRPGCIIER